MYKRKEYDFNYLINLKTCLEYNYSFEVNDIGPEKCGVYGETWYINTDIKKYFVKIHYLSSIIDGYKESLIALEFLKRNNIAFINEVVYSNTGKLYVDFNGGILAVFGFINGEHCGKEQVDYFRTELYKMLISLYRVTLKRDLGTKETFSDDCATYILDKVKEYKLLQKYDKQIIGYYEILNELSCKCKKTSFDFYITHGDASNNIIYRGNQLFLVDWDRFKIACPERDIWFMIRSQEDIKVIQESFYKNGFDYEIKKERLLYYPLYCYFSYLKDHIVSIEETDNPRMKRLILNYIHRLFFDGFICRKINELGELKIND